MVRVKKFLNKIMQDEKEAFIYVAMLTGFFVFAWFLVLITSTPLDILVKWGDATTGILVPLGFCILIAVLAYQVVENRKITSLYKDIAKTTNIQLKSIRLDNSLALKKHYEKVLSNDMYIISRELIDNLVSDRALKSNKDISKQEFDAKVSLYKDLNNYCNKLTVSLIDNNDPLIIRQFSLIVQELHRLGKFAGTPEKKKKDLYMYVGRLLRNYDHYKAAMDKVWDTHLMDAEFKHTPLSHLIVDVRQYAARTIERRKW